MELWHCATTRGCPGPAGLSQWPSDRGREGSVHVAGRRQGWPVIRASSIVPGEPVGYSIRDMSDNEALTKISRTL